MAWAPGARVGTDQPSGGSCRRPRGRTRLCARRGHGTALESRLGIYDAGPDVDGWAGWCGASAGYPGAAVLVWHVAKSVVVRGDCRSTGHRARYAARLADRAAAAPAVGRSTPPGRG